MRKGFLLRKSSKLSFQGEVGFKYLVAAEPPNYPLATTLEMTMILREPHKITIPRNCKDVIIVASDHVTSLAGARHPLFKYEWEKTHSK